MKLVLHLYRIRHVSEVLFVFVGSSALIRMSMGIRFVSFSSTRHLFLIVKIVNNVQFNGKIFAQQAFHSSSNYRSEESTWFRWVTSSSYRVFSVHWNKQRNALSSSLVSLLHISQWNISQHTIDALNYLNICIEIIHEIALNLERNCCCLRSVSQWMPKKVF